MSLLGARFTNYEVIEDGLRGKRGCHYVRAKCECGEVRVVRAAHLLTGASKSCGCRRAPISRARATTHGMNGTPEYKTWTAIIDRCSNAKAHGFENYGGRGIVICPRWRASFEAFFADMGPRPAGTSIDRIDVNGNYEPGNCRWATQREQQNNRRDSRFIEARGERLTVADWARRLGISVDVIRARAGRLGWDAERALFTPVRSVGGRRMNP